MKRLDAPETIEARVIHDFALKLLRALWQLDHDLVLAVPTLASEAKPYMDWTEEHFDGAGQTFAGIESVIRHMGGVADDES